MYYDVNMEFGKIPNNTKTEKEQTEEPNKEANRGTRITDKRIKTQKRKQNLIDNRKPNIIPEELLKEIVDEELNREDIEAMLEEKDAEYNPEGPVDVNENKPNTNEVRDQYGMNEEYDPDSRLAAERSLRWDGRKIGRGGFRFRADV